jgi:TRAP-type C4-dicarboxylate transport system permease small subunit
MQASRYYSGLLNACGLLAGIAIAVMALLITLDVVLRNIGIVRLPWLLEACEYALFVATFFAAPWVLRQGAHVRVDLVLEIVPAALARIIDFAANLVGVAACLLLARHGARIAWDAYQRNDRLIQEIAVSEWLLLAVIPVSAVLLAVEFARRIALGATGRDEGPPPPLTGGP